MAMFQNFMRNRSTSSEIQQNNKQEDLNDLDRRTWEVCGCPATAACSLPLPNRNMPKKEKAQVLNLQVIVASEGLFVGFYIGVLKLRC
ncbi:hypothetical protein Tco_0188687 [Tanacetum coccineum]